MHVGAAEAEAADAGPSRSPVGLPLAKRRVDVERAILEVDPGVGPLEIDRRRKASVLQGQNGFDKAAHSCRRIQVPDVGFDRADSAKGAPLRADPESLRKRRNLNRVAQLGPGSVRLDVADRVRVHAGIGQGFGNHPSLPGNAGGGETNLQRAVIVCRRPLDRRMNTVPVGNRVGKPLEHNYPHAVAKYGALGLGIESMAATIRRFHPSLLIQVTGAVRHLDGHAAGQHHVALMVLQALASHVDGHERRGAGALHKVAGPLQIELVGQSGDHVIGDATVDCLGDPHLPHQVHVAEDVVSQVATIRAAGIYTYHAVVTVGVVTGVFQRLPGTLEHEAMLGIENLRFPWVNPKERGIEHFDVVQRETRLHVPRIIQRVLQQANRAQLLVVEHGPGFHAVPDVPPECFDVPGTRETPSHTDNGNRRVVEMGGLVWIVHGLDPRISFSAARRVLWRCFCRLVLSFRCCISALPSPFSAESRGVPRTRSARKATVKPSYSLATSRSVPKARLIRETTLIARSECPPRSKKLSWTPTGCTPSNSCHIRHMVCSTEFVGATYAFGRSGRAWVGV